MIVVAIIALLASIAVPNFVRSRKRAQATRILQDLRAIDAAIDLYAIEANKTTGSTVTWSQVKLYLKTGTPLYVTGKSILSDSYPTSFTVDSPVATPIGTSAALSDVAPPSFWSPYTLQ
ncbi:MAG: hypothetical protein JWL90_2273 [Chthoniobacteraceae bacterium]|nr:hypothetical protein [Chthoniobacteraceae bacterium]